MVATVLRASDRVAVAAMIDADAYTANTYTSDWVSMANFERLLAVIAVGDLGAGGTVDAKLEQAQDASGTGAKDITGKAITTIDQDGSPNAENTQSLINVQGEDLDVDGGFTHVRLSLTTATATSDAAGVLLGIDPRYGKASDNDAASVFEIV